MRRAAVVLLLCVSARLHAQVTMLRNLTFGSTVAGTTNSVLPTASNAAAFKIHGILVVTSAITFTLPTNLTKSGGGTMPITFCSTCGVYRVGNTNPVGGTTINPKNGLTGLVISVASDLYFRLGGSISPPANQAPGSYSGTVVITVATLL